MNTFKSLTLLTSCLIIAFTNHVWAQDETGKGAIIIVSVEGDVKIKKVKTETFLPKEKVAAGSSFPDGHTVLTGDASKAVLLLSNGSITTIDANTDITFAEFTQKKFEKTDDKLVTLATEPSNSKTKLQLSSGSLVFDVKKLNPGSSFEIDSPVGSAGIRGTVGKIKILKPKAAPNNSPSKGSSTNQSGDIDESTPGSTQTNTPSQNADDDTQIEITMQQDSVEFTDNSGNTQNVDQGQQLTGSGNNFQNNQAPQEELNGIQETQEQSEEQSSDVSVGDAGSASEQATEQSAEESSEESSEESKEESKEESSEETKEESSSSEETTSEESATTQESTNSDDAQQQNLETDDDVQDVQESGGDTKLAHAIEALALSVNQEERLKSYQKALQEKIAYEDYTISETGEENLAQKQTDTKFLMSILLKLNREESETLLNKFYAQKEDGSGTDVYPLETRKNFLQTLNDPQMGLDLLQLSLDQSDLDRVLTYSLNDIGGLVKEPLTRLEGILNYELTPEEINVLMGYSPDLRQKFVDADDQNLVKSLLGLNQTESEITPVIDSLIEKGEIVDDVDTTDKEQTTDEDVVSEGIATLLEDARANGNEHIVDILYEEGDGKIDEALLAVGILGNDLLTDVTISGHLDSSRFFDTKDAIQNLFYQEVALLFDTWILSESDANIEDLGQIFAGRSVTLNSGTVDLDNYFATGQTEFFITAAHVFNLAGDIEFTAQNKSATEELALSLGAGSYFVIAENTSIRFMDGGLNLGSRETSEFVKVSMEAGGDINIASLEDLIFQDISLKVRPGDSIHLEAFSSISVNGLQFSEQLQNIYMEAITIDLRNVFFPDGSTVHLNSMFGGVDGIYPNFGSSEIGRVNFIENVGYHQTIINDRATFDQFQNHIIISPLTSPIGQ